MQPPTPLCHSPLYPAYVREDSGIVGRVLLATSWQVRRATRPGVEGVPFRLHSLLVLDDLFFSVIPWSVCQAQRIHTRALTDLGPAPSWRGIPCTFGLADVWLRHAEQPTTTHLSLTVRLPERSADPDPPYPLIGFEFLRHYQPRLVVDYAAFPQANLPDATIPVGRLELV
jgi:hypothetical protein